jgi:hypothetical protein
MKMNDRINRLLALSLDEKFKILDTYIDLKSGECGCDTCSAQKAECELTVDADLVLVYSDMFRYAVAGRR